MKGGTSITDVVVGFFLLSLIFILVERVLGRRRGQPWLRRGWAVDVMYWFFSPLVTGALARLMLIAPVLVLLWAGVARGEDFRLGQYHGFGPVARQPVWLQIIEIYLMFDFIGYWTHRFFHRRRWWPFHAVHHSSEDLDWLSGVRIHPVNELLSKFCQVTPFLLLGFNPFVTLSTAPFFTFHAIFVHAAVDWNLGHSAASSSRRSFTGGIIRRIARRGTKTLAACSRSGTGSSARIICLGIAGRKISASPRIFRKDFWDKWGGHLSSCSRTKRLRSLRRGRPRSRMSRRPHERSSV